jgi:hypothetical protein
MDVGLKRLIAGFVEVAGDPRDGAELAGRDVFEDLLGR